MELHKTNVDNYHHKVANKINVTYIEDHKYMYPNGHRSTHQMRWFRLDKGIGRNWDLLS